jgi:hypothetical protein
VSLSTGIAWSMKAIVFPPWIAGRSFAPKD